MTLDGSILYYDDGSAPALVRSTPNDTSGTTAIIGKWNNINPTPLPGDKPDTIEFTSDGKITDTEHSYNFNYTQTIGTWNWTADHVYEMTIKYKKTTLILQNNTVYDSYHGARYTR